MIEGIDVSHHQNPDLFDWPGVAKQFTFLVARASYGRGTKDRQFRRFAELARANGLVFGAYHFYRQIHSVEEQLQVFDEQLASIGGLQPGELLPVLDMEHNGVNGDGEPRSVHFADSCRRMAETWADLYGGVILYYSSYFPEYLGVRKNPALTDWMWTDCYRHWLADYSRVAGEPRVPYSKRDGAYVWDVHQPKPRRTPLYASGKKELDHDVINPAMEFARLLIGEDPGYGVTLNGELDVEGTTQRPGGAFPEEEFYDAIGKVREGTERQLEGWKELERNRPSALLKGGDQ